MSSIDYSVLSYFPSITTDENVNIGVIFHNLNTNKCDFMVLKDWERLVLFDKEVDIEFIKSYLKSMELEINKKIINQKSTFDLKGFIRCYVNELRFLKVVNSSVEDVNDFIKLIQKKYLD